MPDTPRNMDATCRGLFIRLMPNDIEQLRQALVGQPGDRKVEADEGTGISERTVDELRARTAWPTGLVVETPRENYPEAVVKIQSDIQAVPPQ
jgi:hypothetical protein